MSLEARWRSLPPHPDSAAFQRIDETHPLDFYLGKDASGEWMLLLITEEQTSFTKENRAIQVSSRKRSDGKWALMFRLVKPELGKLFSLVCDDVVESSRGNPDPAHPASFVLARFGRWQRLLEKGNSGLLDDTALRGLVGELLFLESIAVSGLSGREVVTGWCGPAGADRDFSFPDHDVEVKTVHDGADHVVVSSAEQLDAGSKPVFLAIVFLDDVAPGASPEAFTVLDLVDRLQQALASDPTAVDILDSKLLEAGLLMREEYAERAFILRNMRRFAVEDGFPAIRRSGLPTGIGKVSWELLIASILPFEIEPIR